VTQATDVVLGGVGYMVVPGKYKRRGERTGGQEQTGRQRVGAFGRGLRFGVEDGSGGGWDGLKVGGVGGGQGVEPWPGDGLSAADAILAPSLSVRPASAVQADRVYLAIGRFLYRSASLGAGAWSAWTQVYDVGATKSIRELVQWSDDLLLCLGATDDVLKFNTTSLTTSVWRTGEKAVTGIAFKGQMLYSDGVTQERFSLSLTKYNGTALTRYRWLDSPIVAFGMWGARVVIATKRGLWLFDGTPAPGEADDPDTPSNDPVKPDWIGEPEPLFTHGTWIQAGDFPFLVAFAGRLWTWVGGRIASWSGAANGQWVWERLEGQACRGATVAGGYLVAAIVARDGSREIWATDGGGWWLIDRAASNQPERLNPANLGGCGGFDVAVFRDGSVSYDRFRTARRSLSQQSYPSGGSANWVSALLDGERGEAVKTWEGVGARFAWPESRGDAGSADTVTISLDYSLDAGATWTQAATRMIAGGGTRLTDLTASLPAGAVGRYLQLRVRWSSVVDWAPVLTGVWADWRLTLGSGIRQRWAFDVLARDAAIDRDGNAGGSGQAAVAGLWSAWETGAALTLRDLDYDADPVERQVIVAEVTESAAKPADAGRFGGRVVTVELVEAS
jgi:hypothetical protein